jgi:hypothetical protein
MENNLINLSGDSLPVSDEVVLSDDRTPFAEPHRRNPRATIELAAPHRRSAVQLLQGLRRAARHG